MTDKNDGRLDPKGPNKFVPEPHPPFPNHPKAEPGNNKKRKRKAGK